ncbi:SDR family NAD(P)-dependent oxidoreductase [Limnohabitans sp.]|jgi:meso-butanediol dehydrogenase/(S,S)-butanediol dehydrogenase/diacetyl reductase|uniref:SDR family NAD(P)-dependent oxidoreductase n=1 Tax=Limnohabitans sp. TaxID=1907725 RepID=UPI00391AF97E
MGAPRLEGKAAIITGAGSGIGAATAMLFCQEGASVHLVDANSDGLEMTRQAIEGRCPTARVLCTAADVQYAESAHAVATHTVRDWGAIDILVNNAAMRDYAPADRVTPAQWHAVVSVNLVGLTHYCQAALPHLRKAQGGCIVNVSSCYAIKGRKGMALYDASKAAQLSLTRTLACEEAVHGVRVNAVLPGSTLTQFHIDRAAKAGKSVEQLKTERKSTSLLGRWATPEEIAWPVLWLASPEASFITGSQLVVDGGLHII